MDVSLLEKYDPQDMHKTYDVWPKIARESWESDISEIYFENIDHIIFVGMGGSGAIGDMFASILSKSKIHVTVVKGFHLPSTINSNSLVIPISVSGNTQETLTVLKLSHLVNCNIIAFVSGGEIQKYCLDNNIEYRIIPQHHSPRASFPSYFYSILRVLSKTLNIKSNDILESITELENLGKQIASSNLTKTNLSLNLAQQFSGIPMIYHPFGLQSAAIRFKNSLNENTKIHAICEDIVEATHNGIVAWEKNSNVFPIIVKGEDDYEKTKKLWNFVERYFKENKINYVTIQSLNGSIITKLICLIYLLDYTSIYAAIYSETDPTPVKPINYFKNLKT
jgi:glucose/mannose-6-phosphate isomerase